MNPKEVCAALNELPPADELWRASLGLPSTVEIIPACFGGWAGRSVRLDQLSGEARSAAAEHLWALRTLADFVADGMIERGAAGDLTFDLSALDDDTSSRFRTTIDAILGTPIRYWQVEWTADTGEPRTGVYSFRNVNGAEHDNPAWKVRFYVEELLRTAAKKTTYKLRTCKATWPPPDGKPCGRYITKTAKGGGSSGTRKYCEVECQEMMRKWHQAEKQRKDYTGAKNGERAKRSKGI